MKIKELKSGKKVILLLLILGLVFSQSFIRPIKTLSAGPEKIGIFTNSFGYYIYVADPIKNRVIKYSSDGLFLGVPIPTVSTHVSGEKWTIKKVVDIVTCRLTDVIGVADAGTGHSYIYELNGHTHHKNGKPGSGKGEVQELWDVAMTEIDATKSQALLDRKGCKVSHWQPPPGGTTDPKDGTWIRDFGSKGSGNGQLLYPESCVYDRESNLWVADTGNNRIVKFDIKGNFIMNVGKAGSGNGEFKEPCEVAVDFYKEQGNKLYVLDRGNKRVQVFTSKGQFVKAFPLKELNTPSSMTVDLEGNVWVSDIALNKIFKYNNNGKLLLTISNAINPQEIKRTIVRVYIGKYIMKVNDEPKAIDAPPFIESGRTLVPIRAISEPLGAKVEWNEKDRKVTIRLGGNTIEMWIGNPQGKINSKPYKIPDGVPPKIVKNRTFVPVRFVAEGLGAVVNWNPKDAQIGSGAVTVYYPK